MNEDGGQFEDSPSYHRLVLELLLIALGTIERCGDGDRIEDFVYSRIESMLDYVVQYTRPDGSCPNFGDSDSSRILVTFPENCKTNVSDHAETVALGALMRGRPDLLAACGSARVSAAWAQPKRLLEFQGRAGAELATVEPECTLHPLTGTAVLRSERFHVVVKCGANGQDGYGGHSHNDKLSLELCDSAGPVLVDSGTYCYTLDYRARAELRATAAHNTLQLGAIEQNAFDPHRAFGYSTDGPVRVLHWRGDDLCWEFVGEFGGYDSLVGKPLHRRLVLLDRIHDVLVVDDAVVSSRVPALPCTVSWHLAPRAAHVELEEGLARSDLGESTPLELTWEPLEGVQSVASELQPSVYSQRYGEAVPGAVLRLSWRPAETVGRIRTVIDGGAPRSAALRARDRADRLTALLLG